MNKQAFCTERYFTEQMNEFEHRVSMSGFNRTIIEFGGKGRGDQHAARVLPGYDKDIKAKILYGLQQMGMRLMMVLNTQDILQQPDGRTLQGRIRGDTGLRYHEEVIRQIDEAYMYGLQIEDVALSVFPGEISDGNAEFLSGFQNALQTRGVHLHIYKKLAGYPDNVELQYGNPFLGDSFVSGEKDIVLISPGGGSGKFGVAISEIAHQLYAGKNPNFIKFETFPVFELEYHHPLNLAFEAATADLKNEVIQTLGGVSYDKDIENHRLLLALYAQAEKELPYFLGDSPVQFGVNKIHTGIVDGGKVREACRQEIKRRIERYTQEVSTGNERRETLLRAQQIYSLC